MAQTGKKYVPSKADIQYVYECCCQGISQSQILDGLKIDWHTYQKNLPVFSDAIKKGKEQFDLHLERQVPQVVNALLRKCLGYEVEETSQKRDGKVVNGQLFEGDITITKTTKHIQPNEAAIFFFLCNRDKMQWINPMRIDDPTTDNKGEIMKFIDSLKKEPETKKKKNDATR